MHTFIKPENWNELPINQKIKIYGDSLTPDYAKFIDKIEAKKYIEENFGDKIKVAKLIRIIKSPKDINENDINPDHMLKSAHGCEWNINLSNPVTIKQIYKNLLSWNKQYKPDKEIQYSYLTPRFFIEEKVNDKYFGNNFNGAIVYMFQCINGEPITIRIRNHNKRNSWYINKTLIEEKQFDIDLPDCIDTMIEYAKLLSKPFEFVRIDFYLDTNNDIYFSEFTFTPSGGHAIYSPEVELELGKLWQ